MRLHRFYIKEAIDSDSVKINNEEIVHQWRNVFRYLVGGQVVVFNGDGYDYFCMISELGHKTAVLSVTSKKKSILPTKNVDLIVSIIKKDNVEWIIQKATELGVSKIFLIISERSEKKSLNMIRANKIAIESSEQSGRGDVPEIFEPKDLKDFLVSDELKLFKNKVLFHPKGVELDASAKKTTSVVMAIGPEGGFSEDEVELFLGVGFKQYSLGSLVLRAETAAISGLSLLLL